MADSLKVFDKAIWPGQYHLFFKNCTFEYPAVAKVGADIRVAWYLTLPGRKAKGPRKDHLNVTVFPCCDFGNCVRHNTDVLPAFEYDWLARTFGRWISPRTNLLYMKLPTKKMPVLVE